MIDDMELLRRYLQGSEEAFAELVRRHVDFVYAAALRRSRNAHRAQDVVQTVFIALARKARTLLDRREIVGWLFVSSQYAAVSLVRSEARRTERQETAHLLQHQHEEVSPQEDWQTIEPFLDVALEALSENDRSAVLLRFFKNHSFAEIGTRLAISEDAARKRVDRALGKIRQLLNRHGITSTAAAIGVAMANQPAICAPVGMSVSVTQAVLSGAAIATSSTIGSGLLSTKSALVALAVTTAAVFWVISEKSSDKVPHPVSVDSSTVENRAGPSAPDNALQTPSPSVASGEDHEKQPPVTKPHYPASASTDRTARDRAVIIRRYGSLYEELNLSSEKRDQVTQLLLDLRNTPYDFAAASAQFGQDPTDDEERFSASLQPLRTELKNQLREVLGAEGYGKFLLADQTIRQIAIVERLEKRLRRTPHVLSKMQIDQLKALVLEHQIETVTDEVITDASRYLTTPQVQALREIKAHAELGAQKPKIQKAIVESLTTGRGS